MVQDEALVDPVKRLKHPLLRFLPWFAGTLIFCVIAVNLRGLRGDIEQVFENAAFLFEVSLASMIAVSAAMASVWLCVPDMRGQKWLVTLPITLMVVFALWSGVRIMTEGIETLHIHMIHCVYDSLIFGFVPVVLMSFISMKGFTTKPRLMAFMNVASASAIGWAALRCTCANDLMGHTLLYHFLPFVLAGSVFGMLIQRFYRW